MWPLLRYSIPLRQLLLVRIQRLEQGRLKEGRVHLLSVKYLPEEMCSLNYVGFSKVFTYIIINVLYTV